MSEQNNQADGDRDARLRAALRRLPERLYEIPPRVSESIASSEDEGEVRATLEVELRDALSEVSDALE